MHTKIFNILEIIIIGDYDVFSVMVSLLLVLWSQCIECAVLLNCGIHSSSFNEKKYQDMNQIRSRFNKKFFLKLYFVNRLLIISCKCFNKFMYFLILVKLYNFYINDIVIVVSKNVDNVLLKMVDPTETCQGWIIKNHTGWCWKSFIFLSKIITTISHAIMIKKLKFSMCLTN
jgi:hypothetical protein